ncbi:MAG: OadG family protein [Treponema sp.]|jgi:oxaloacetate decarboxylase gamma subunit|nr:OadG family protein [Treponema sp.]
MTIFEMLEQSALLTVLGMIIVFVFLWIMIICVNLVAKIIHKAGLDKDILPVENDPQKNKSRAVNRGVTAAISAAVTEYQKKE